MSAEQQQRYVKRGIWIYLTCLLLFTGLAWAPFLLHGCMKADFPLTLFSERFGDLAHFASAPQKLANPTLEDFNHLAGMMFPRNYGPLAVILYLFLLGVCSPYGVIVFLLIVVSVLALGAFILWRAARRSPNYRPFMAAAIVGTSLLSLPTAETELRGNIEGLLWIGYAAGVGYMFSRKWGRAASVLAVASCIKPYPMFLFVALLWRRKYKQAIMGCFVFLITTVGCLCLLGKGNPIYGAARIRGNSDFFSDYIVGFRDVNEVATDHSLFQTSKSIVRIVKAGSFRLPEKNYGLQRSVRAGYILLAIYIPFAGFFLIWIVRTLRKKPFLNQIFSLSICLTLLPLIAGDYTLTILYMPMGLFLLFLLRQVSTGRVFISQTRILCVLVPCAWLMSPQPLFGIWAGDAKSVVLAFLLYIVLHTPMQMRIDVDERLETIQ